MRPFQKLIEREAFYLLKNLGSHIYTHQDVENGKMFYKTFVYSGLPRESITET